jgi:hypothetical protein
MRSVVIVCLALLTPVRCFAQGSTTVASEPHVFSGTQWTDHVTTSTGAIATPEDARVLIASTLASIYPNEVDLGSSSFACIVHVVRFADPAVDQQTGSMKQSVASQNWYVVQGSKTWSHADFAVNKRLFGQTRAWLLYVHLNVIKENIDESSYHPHYAVSVTPKTPTNVSHLNDALKLFQANESDAVSTVNVWGGGPLEIDTVPANVSISAKLAVGNGAETTIGDAQAFNDEGLYRWDVSIGVPIRAMNQLTVDSSSGTATPTTVDKRTALACLDVFLWPVDVTDTTALKRPHVVVGVSISQRPLDEILVAGAWGPTLASFYLGAAFVRQSQVGTSTRTTDVQFAFGVNISVTAAASAFQKAAAK